jgi:hypothetical protein
MNVPHLAKLFLKNELHGGWVGVSCYITNVLSFAGGLLHGVTLFWDSCLVTKYIINVVRKALGF